MGIADTEREKLTEEWYRKEADEKYANDGLEVDEDSKVSLGDDEGAWVQVWKWIPGEPDDDDLQEIKNLQEHQPT